MILDIYFHCSADLGLFLYLTLLHFSLSVFWVHSVWGYFYIFLFYLYLNLCMFWAHSGSKHSEQYYVPNGNMKHRQWSYCGQNQIWNKMVHVSGCSREVNRNVIGEMLAPVPGMIRPRQAVLENCSGGRGFLWPYFQDDITEVSSILKKMSKGWPVSTIVSNIKIVFLHIASCWCFTEWLLG